MCGLNHSFAALEAYLGRWMTGKRLIFRRHQPGKETRWQDSLAKVAT